MMRNHLNIRLIQQLLVVFIILFPAEFLAQGTNLDRYGGCLDKPIDDGEEKGFFRTNYDGEQWWLLTPDNNAFLSFGLNHFHSNLWAKEWNKTYWEGAFGGNVWSDTWKEGFYSHAQEMTSLVRANSMGYHNEDQVLLSSPKFLPYIRQYRPIEFSLHQNPTEEDFVDIFSDEFVQTCANVAQTQVAPYVEDTMIIGFAMADVPVLTEEYAYSISNYKGYDLPTWPRVLRNLSATSPGKLRYVECMMEQYDGSITDFNSVYNTTFFSWEDLKNAEDWRPEAEQENTKETSDNNAFNKICINKYYQVAFEAFRSVDAMHLFFGDKINANLKDSDELKLIVNEIKDYVDVVLIQCYGRSDYQEQIHARIAEVADLPIINGDGGFGARGDPKMPNPQYPVADDQAQRAEWILEYAETAFANPNFVGYHLCGVIDGWNTTGTQKPGIINPLGEKHTEVIETLSTIGGKLYEYRGIVSTYVPPDTVTNSTDELQDWGAYENIKEEAAQRIEQHRKGDARLRVLLPNQELAANTELRVKLKRHDFKWGAVVKESFATSPYSDKYREIFLKYFNATGFGVALKPKFRSTSREETTYTVSMPWFLKNDIYVRGHTLAWEGINFMRPEDQAIYNDATLSDQVKGDSLLKSCGIHFPHAIPKWDVKCWDVSNESIGNNLINDLLPDYNSHVHWFKLADSIRRECGKDDVVLYQNDYQIISAISSWALNYTKEGYSAVGRPALYREIMDEQIALGAPIEGIGFQSRLKHGLITPDSIYKRLCDFDRYNLPFQATEFEIRDDVNKYVYTDAQRRLLTEYMMLMYFSHPKVNGFWQWTFADSKSTENLDYPLFNYDGSPKVNGLKWIELMEGFLTTDKSVKTNGWGDVNVRGYYGSYELIAEIGDDVFVGTFEIDSTNTDSIILVNLDRGYNLTGLEDSAAYDLDQALNIGLTAFSNSGDIASIGLFLKNDSIGGATGSSCSLNYILTSSVEGWNAFTVRIIDDQGNKFSHSINVYFGSTLPLIEIISQPDDTIYAGSTGNNIAFNVSGTYRTINSLVVSYAGNIIFLPDTSGTFEFSLDTLAIGSYQFIIEVRDDKGGIAGDTVSFTVSLAENILPVVEITSPEDSSLISYGSDILLTIDASDSDGTISSVEILLNDSPVYTFYEGPYSLNLDTLSIGAYKIIAIATDDSFGQASDTIHINVEDETSSSSGLMLNTSGIVIYPNPASNTFYFSKICDYEIYTIPGVRVLEGKEALQVDVSQLGSGLYLVKTNYGVSKLRKV